MVGRVFRLLFLICSQCPSLGGRLTITCLGLVSGLPWQRRYRDLLLSTVDQPVSDILDSLEPWKIPAYPLSVARLLCISRSRLRKRVGERRSAAGGQRALHAVGWQTCNSAGVRA